MKSNLTICLLFLVVAFSSCKNDWEKHYGVYPETVDQNVWEAMNNDQGITLFVQYLKENKFDTLFLTNDVYSLFAPSNEAMQEFLNGNEIDTTLLRYHISKHFIQLENINGKRKIETFSSKFALLERSENISKLDGIAIDFESPLYENGRYFIIDKVASPLPNLYEFFTQNNEVLKTYIDSQDSIVLDREKSIPIGFDENGNTIYDSASIIYNKFEEEYFKVSKEFRNRTATIVFPLKEDYNTALTEMAQYIGGNFIDFNDIPMSWQQEVLVPYLLKRGVFENMLEPSDFVPLAGIDTLKLKNILGDSVNILYTPVDKAICSNGYAYNYMKFEVPDSLYKEGSRFETESLLEATGIDKYAWNDRAKVVSDKIFEPYREFVSLASNDSLLRVLFPLNYNGNFSLEFTTAALFPRRYLMIVKTHMDYGGIYNIYVNDILVNTFDYYDYVKNWGGIINSVTGDYCIPEGRFNKFDMYVDNITEFGRAKVKFEYIGPGNVSTQGLVIDYVEFLPVSE